MFVWGGWFWSEGGTSQNFYNSLLSKERPFWKYQQCIHAYECFTSSSTGFMSSVNIVSQICRRPWDVTTQKIKTVEHPPPSPPQKKRAYRTATLSVNFSTEFSTEKEGPRQHTYSLRPCRAHYKRDRRRSAGRRANRRISNHFLWHPAFFLSIVRILDSLWLW